MLALRADTLSLIQGCQSAGPSRLTHSCPEHQPASALEGAMEKHTRLIAPYPTDQWGLSLSENGSANLCEAVLMYRKPCQVITMLILNMQLKRKNKYKCTLLKLKKRLLRLKLCIVDVTNLKRQTSVHAEKSSPSSSGIKDTGGLRASLKLLSRGQSLCASLFVALLCCHRGWPYGSQKDRGCVLW